MMIGDDIHSTQQLTNAAEAFVEALGVHFPHNTFDQLFHGGTLRRAYWTALQSALDSYATPENEALARALLEGQVLADARVVGELLKLFLPGDLPNYDAVGGLWSAASDDTLRLDVISFARETETLFSLIADELRRSPDLRLALQQIGRARYAALEGLDEATTTAEQDLSRLLEAALVTGPSTLVLQVRHLLALSAQRDAPAATTDHARVNALARLCDHLMPGALNDLWTEVKAIEDPDLRLRLLGQIVPRLAALDLTPDPLALIQNTIEGAPGLDPVVRVDVLLALAPHLDTPTRDPALPSFQQRVVDAARSIDDPASRVRALSAMIETLSPELQSEAVNLAFESARAIPSDMACATALSVLPPHLPQEFQTRLLTLAYELETPDARALLLGRMIPALPASLRSQALTGALQAIEQIMGDEARTGALIALAPYVDSVGPLQYVPEGLQQVILVTFSITQADDRARAFAALAPYLSPELLQEALQTVRDIADPDDRALTLAKLAPHLPLDLQVAAFGIARELPTPQARATALAAIAPYLAPTARAQALADALVSALMIEQRYARVVALVDLAPHLPDDLKLRALQEALTATRSIPDETERARALVFLAPHLLREQMPDALADAYTVLDPVERVPALCALIPHLPSEPRERVTRDVINLARALKPPTQKASILASVAPVLPDDLVDEAIEVALRIEPPYDRMHVLTVLLPHRSAILHDEALAAAHAVPNRYQRVSALLELVPHTAPALRQPILDQALETANGILDDYDRASALAHIAPYIDPQGDARNRKQDALGLALDACLQVTVTAERAALLHRLALAWARLLSPAQSYPLWRRVVVFLRRRPYADVLADLAALAPVIDHMGATMASDELADALGPALVEPS